MSGFKNSIARASNTSIGWKVISRIWRLDDKLQRLLRFAERHRAAAETTDFYERVRTKFPGKEVMHGPFRGLQYGDQNSIGSSLIPKLLGSYENELHPWFETVPDKNYDTIVDVGCAEGYYAVGLARMLPKAQVIAYDISPDAQQGCQNLAALNGVADRVTMGAFCDPATLQSQDLGRRALIISDCEGYEATLFDQATVAHLGRADVVIECHDHFGQPITKNLIDLFSKTHTVTIVETEPDHVKALELDLPELAGEPYPVRIYMVEERRLVQQNFLIFEARTSE